MKTLVTGATGFVGSAIARRLLSEGHDVRVLVRDCSNRQNLKGLEVDCAVGDLNDRASLKKALSGCSALFHAAADYRLFVPHPQSMYQTNVTGTVNILQAAADAGVSRMVYTSTVGALGLTADGAPADETTPVTIADMVGHYKRSKFLAEYQVKKMVEKQGLPVVIVNPSTPVGPRDVRPTPTGRMILNAVKGRMPAYVNTGLNIVHVDDVAQGHLLAFKKGIAGERYILGGEDMSLAEILRRIAALTHRRPPRMRIPVIAVLPVAYVSEAWARLTGGGEPLTTIDGTQMARKNMFFSCEKARRDLGYAPRPADEALREAVKWFCSSLKSPC